MAAYRFFRHNHISIHTCIYKQAILWSYKQAILWSYNIFMQILHRYLRYTARLLDAFILLLSVISAELDEKPRRKD